ncbi:periplasmic nitrate reductase, NapE protein (plasmid) [Cereibacter azotoformans]|uniref:Periplasmic nitrate reductase subunit NapE n=2 Tax=Cereibacter TaxID=1653176 RepID=A0A2T5JVR5_9RHOB|nr:MULTISPECIES: periplasmic nitrate reductase, NapE protein [Cereibacter]AXQ95956.1 periplasmic nitrate reductase, NapE protein [Cereibacter sphaeroides]PTR14236.1 periplasmic nitrate reductase subunit NapE [Cereibacter azotoformans]UIJ33025.1 periplasmic nitrate reductase, NapE protein [Cereibacter azotoformans]ULB12033.1 periplasmic nitrate reductase, NapE protein [Cereibacter azotoformans]
MAEDPPRTTEMTRTGRRGELFVFFVLAAVIWPFLSIAFVGGYGFLIWMWQIVFGPPGPPV